MSPLHTARETTTATNLIGTHATVNSELEADGNEQTG